MSVAPPIERRTLPEREPIEPKKLLEKRADVIAGLNTARDALAKKDAPGAISALAPIGSVDPLGGALALSLARAALSAGDASTALRAASRAVTAGRGRQDLLGPAGTVVGAALEKLGRPRGGAEEGPAIPRPAAGLHAETAEQACKVIETEIRAGKVDLPSSSATDVSEFTCAIDMSLDVDAGALRRAHALRADVGGPGGSDRLIWVAFETGQGVSLYGPVASVFGAKIPGVLNDVVVDLQKIDVLPGGAPEVVTKITEKRTLPDVALDELLEIDETRAVILTVDRGGILPSREVVLSSRAARSRMEPGSKRMPNGFSSVQGGARVTEYSMKVAWGGPNSMTLTKVSGDGKPRVEGDVQLFP